MYLGTKQAPVSLPFATSINLQTPLQILTSYKDDMVASDIVYYSETLYNKLAKKPTDTHRKL
jgi:hypothetical protein